MKKDIHPRYEDVKVIMTDGEEFYTKTTAVQNLKKDENGEYVIRLDVDPKTHPAWSGEQKLMDSDQVSKFKARFKGFKI